MDDFSGVGSGDIFNNATFTGNETVIELSCQERQVEFGFPLPISDTAAITLRYIQVIYYLVSFPLGVFLNLFVVLLILRFKKLQNVTFILAVQVSVGDLINAAIVYPTSAANAIADRYVFTGLCTTIGFVVFYLRIVRIYLMFVLVLDRFLTVFMPFWYQRHRVKVVVPFSLGAWILAFIIGLIPAKGLLDCYSFQRNTWACVPTNGCLHRNACSIYNSTAVALSNSCNIVSVILYFSLFIKARKLRNKIFILRESDESSEIERTAAAQKVKRERRANITFFLLFIVLVGVNFPPFIFFVLGRPIITSLMITPPQGYTIAGVIGRAMYPLLTIFDPLVIMRNEDFKEVFKKLWKNFRKPNISGATSQATTGPSTTGVTE